LAFLSLPIMSAGMVNHSQCWTQLGSDIDGEQEGDYSGSALSLSKDGLVVAIGAYNNDGGDVTNAGHVRVHEWNVLTKLWMQRGADIDGILNSEKFGSAVSLSEDGSRLAIGASRNTEYGTNSGRVSVYMWQNSAWSQMGQNIYGDKADDSLGGKGTVSMSGDGSKLALGLPGSDEKANSAGKVVIYNIHEQQIEHVTSIQGENAQDQSGGSVSLSYDGSAVAIGSEGNSNNGYYSGHVRVFVLDISKSEWAQLGDAIAGEYEEDMSGTSVSVSNDGTVLAIGAVSNDGNGISSGHVRVFKWNAVGWSQLGDAIYGDAELDYAGRSISLSGEGTVVAIGSDGNDDNGNRAGHVRVFDWHATTESWSMRERINGEAEGDKSGYSVSLSDDGTVVAIGATDNDDNGNNAGHVRILKYGDCDRKVPKSTKSSKTNSPTRSPNVKSTKAPQKSTKVINSPTKPPSSSPTKSSIATIVPTRKFSFLPTMSPIDSPTHTPTSKSPTTSPNDSITDAPTDLPTKTPTFSPTQSPTDAPTAVPTRKLTSSPTMAPTSSPTVTTQILLYPGYRYTPYVNLNDENKAAATVLNYTDSTWDIPGNNEIEYLGFESLTQDQKEAAKSIGFPIETYDGYDGEYSDTWDCYVNHYYDFAWATLVAYDLAQYYEVLGFTEDLWSGGDYYYYPTTYALYWEDLSTSEKAAADMLCYFEQTWNMEDSIDLWPDELKGELQV